MQIYCRFNAIYLLLCFSFKNFIQMKNNMEKKKKNTASVDRDGNLSISGTFNFEGSLVKLRKLIDDTIEEYGEDTNCKLNVFGSFPHRWSTHLIITNKKINNS